MMLETVVIGVPFIAAIIYLVVELADLKIWWNRRRQPPSRPKAPPSLADSWPHDKQMEAEEQWEKMLEGDQDA